MNCPYCGFNLGRPVSDGIASCKNCNRVFDTCKFNRILSASWLARRQNITSIDKLVYYGYELDEATIVIENVVDQCFSHQEFVSLLKNMNISIQYMVN